MADASSVVALMPIRLALRGAEAGEKMNTGLQFDQEMAERMEAMYETDDMVNRRKAVVDALELQPGGRRVNLLSQSVAISCKQARIIESA